MKESESGRSMVEMLGVLAVVGVLSVVVIVTLRTALDKAHATQIVHDARLVFAESMTRSGDASTDWIQATYGTESGKIFFMKRDSKDNNYVKVEDVEQGVCEQMLNMTKVGELGFLTTENMPFTTCEASNTMIVGFDGVGDQIPCETIDNCPGGENYNGYCDTKAGYCHECEGLEVVNSTKTACVCDTTKAVSCSDAEGNHWCCGDESGESNLICGGSAGSCQANEDGKCHYYFTQTSSAKTLCHYTVSLDETAGEGSVHKKVGCPEKQYCYLLFSNTNCSTASKTITDLWGLCHPKDATVFDFTCSTNAITEFKETKGCPANTYCSIKWRAESCSILTNNYTGTLYGACVAKDEVASACPY